MQITGDFVKGMIKDGYGYMLEKYDALEEVWPLLYNEKEIDGDFWQETVLVNSGNWTRTSETEGYKPQPIIEGWTVYGCIFDYTQAISFSNRVMSDHQKIKNLIKETSGGWGQTAKEKREEFYALPFNYGGLNAGHWIFNGTPESHAVTDSSGDLCYDGFEFFNLVGDERSSKGGGTYYNGHALDLTPDNLKTIRLRGQSNNNRRENDTVIKLLLDTLLLPAALEDTGNEILNSTLVPYLTTNTSNVLQGKLNPITWQYLTDTNAFFVGKAKTDGLLALKRQEPIIDIFQDKKNRCWWATAEMRIGMMMKNWRMWNGSNFSVA